MCARLLVTCAVAIALIGCSNPTAAPGSQTPGNSPAAPTATPAGATSNPATPTPAAATATPAAGNTGGSGDTGTVDGTWTGTWTKPAGGGTITLQLQQSGTNVTGTVTMVGSVCIPPGTAVSGTIAGSNIVFTATGSGFQAQFGGSIKGNSMTGTLNAGCSAGSATGTWNVTRS